jgi:hypothetical protein
MARGFPSTNLRLLITRSRPSWKSNILNLNEGKNNSSKYYLQNKVTVSKFPAHWTPANWNQTFPFNLFIRKQTATYFKDE